ncbi:MAG: hypothetical protein DWQ47_10915 [Acidobacteria bacterium]|nr:MAG: hypothetical protein DWQ32_13330 [Acidobacteriota bacterium]REJ98093.1 MAG: hypothetical protein DWQ38_16130 [Acidobacteriota bacterium]REK16836.1 MAG: hypothetical protein DWQ43_01175 [Acidobacteriota bacterium]REK42747.1 MAG: hypothetical protein DWQ47_10915 [Acidobacteriota bacterium]
MSFVLPILLVVILGCSGVTDLFEAPNSDSDQNQADANPSPEMNSGNGIATVSKSSPCFHKYYPIDTKTVRKYGIFNEQQVRDKEFDDPSSTYEFSQEYDGGETFADLSKFSTGLTLTVSWECTADGLNNNQFVGDIQQQENSLDFKPLKSEGVFFPTEEWTVGKEWKYELTALMVEKGTPDSEGTETNVVSTVKVLAIDEEIEVPGGTFYAAKLEIDTKFKLALPNGQTTNADLRSTAWYSPEVGLVMIAQEGFAKQTSVYLGNQ